MATNGCNNDVWDKLKAPSRRTVYWANLEYLIIFHPRDVIFWGTVPITSVSIYRPSGCTYAWVWPSPFSVTTIRSRLWWVGIGATVSLKLLLLCRHLYQNYALLTFSMKQPVLTIWYMRCIYCRFVRTIFRRYHSIELARKIGLRFFEGVSLVMGLEY